MRTLTVVELVPLFVAQVAGVEAVASVRVPALFYLLACYALVFGAEVLLHVGLGEHLASNTAGKQETDEQNGEAHYCGAEEDVTILIWQCDAYCHEFLLRIFYLYIIWI